MSEKGDRFKINWGHRYLIIVAGLFFIAGFSSGYVFFSDGENEKICPFSFNITLSNELFADVIGEKAASYVDEKFLRPQGASGELVKVESYGDSLYRVIIRATKEGVTQTISLLATRDGKLILLGEGGGVVEIPESYEANLTFREVAKTDAIYITSGLEIRPEMAAYIRGSKDAPITFVEFNDFQCPFCKRFRDQSLDLILTKYEGKIRYVLLDFPITSIHPQAPLAHIAARCAGEQGKYFEYHNKLFAKQESWSRMPPDSVEEINEFESYAVELGLDEVKFSQCLNSRKYENAVLSNMEIGARAGVTGTPTFFINGQKVGGAQPYQVFESVIESQLS